MDKPDEGVAFSCGEHQQIPPKFVVQLNVMIKNHAARIMVTAYGGLAQADGDWVVIG
ncbi:hypothetical protein COLO4_04506 [Corchorus olitorius]|uniref:Uncharacterized protein n=1 Tax=Corchorus olitorius TaxID=93759 RepID=A0A1R3KTM4_9ROSI|nr:hypothetical protein COLO4_04506 [Corchorus olitorius]